MLETSFWTAAYWAEIAANCSTTLFRHLRGQLLDPPPEVSTPLARFGPGEAKAIALAHDLGLDLLINEHRAGGYAANLGIAVVTVPAVVVLLRAEGIISARAAGRKLDLIEPITARRMIEHARRAIDAL